MFFFTHVLGTVLALASPSPAPSVSPSPVPEIAHVYTTDRSDETLNNAVRTTYVVTHEQIARYGYRTIADALASVPAVELSPLGPVGSNVNYGIRGSSSSQVLVLVDGLPAPGSFSNTVELGNLPTTGVDRVEIVEGGGSTLYGTGAIGGIINIITQRTASNGGALRGGSFGDREIVLDSAHVQFSRLLARNNYALPDGSVRPDSDYQSTAFHANVEKRLGAVDVAFRAGSQADELGAPGPDGFVSPTSRENDLNQDANLNLSHKGSRSQTTLQIGGTNQRILFSCDSSADSNCFLSWPALDTEGRVSLSARNVVEGANEQLLYGVDLSRGVVRADTGSTAFLAPGSTGIATNALAQTAGYVQERLQRSWGDFYAGLRGERDGGFGGEFSPSAGLLVHLSNEAAIKANFATAFRAPNASELFFPGYGFSGLHPERAKVADLSLVDSHLAGGASVTWFTNRTNDLIVPVLVDPSTFTYGPRNIDRAFIQGLTLDVRTPASRGITTSLNVTDLYRAENVDTGARLPNDPVIAANLRLDYTSSKRGAVDALGFWIHVAGDRGTVDRTLPLFDQPAAFTTVNAYARFRAGAGVLLTLRGYNLGNERYAAVGGYPMPGRSFLLEVSTR